MEKTERTSLKTRMREKGYVLYLYCCSFMFPLALRLSVETFSRQHESSRACPASCGPHHHRSPSCFSSEQARAVLCGGGWRIGACIVLITESRYHVTPSRCTYSLCSWIFLASSLSRVSRASLKSVIKASHLDLVKSSRTTTRMSFIFSE